MRANLDGSVPRKRQPTPRPSLADLSDPPPPSKWFDARRAGRHTLRRVPVGLAAARRDARWAEAWEQWLRKHRWDWFVTLTWAVKQQVSEERAERDAARRVAQVSEERAERDVARWLARLRRWRPETAAVVAFEEGPGGGRRHVHALVYTGGERYGLPTLAGLWHLGHLRGRWPHGLTQVRRYRPWRHPGRGAAAYTVKGLTEVEVHGPMPPAYRPRRRRPATIIARCPVLTYAG